MFEGLKEKYMAGELERIRGGMGEVEKYASEFAGELIQHEVYLEMHGEYESRLGEMRKLLEGEQARSRQISDQYALAKTKFECELAELRMQNQQSKKQYQLDLLYYASEIEKLKSTIASLKTPKQPTPKQRQLLTHLTSLQNRLQQLATTICQQDTTISSLRDQRTNLMMEILNNKEKKVHEKINYDLELNPLKSRLESLERANRELEFKNRHYRDEAEKAGRELEEARRVAKDREDRMQVEGKNIKERHEQTVEELELENKKLTSQVLKMEAESHYQKEIMKRYDAERREEKETPRERERNVKERVYTEKKKEYQSRIFSEDPQERSQKKKINISVREHQRLQPPAPRRAQTKDNKPRHRQPQPRKPPTPRIITPDPHMQPHNPQANIQPRPRYTTQTDHHCKCLKVQKYRHKLTEANQKIMQLLTDKCRMKLELSHFKRSKAKELTMLEVTGDFDNVVVL